jgi:hypothetical protein
VQARGVDDATDADAPVLRLFERHAMVRTPGPDCADRKLARDTRDFILCCTVDLALSVMYAGTCPGLNAETYACGDCWIGSDSGCQCGAACAGDVCCS